MSKFYSKNFIKAYELFQAWQEGIDDTNQSTVLCFCFENDIEYDEIEKLYYTNYVDYPHILTAEGQKIRH